VRTIVVDASAAVELLRQTPAGQHAGEALRGTVAVAPAHLDAEVLSALARLVRAHGLASSFVEPALIALTRAPITRYPLPPLLLEAWALRANIAQRDALYVVLARRVGASLLTADARLAGVPKLGVRVTVVGS